MSKVTVRVARGGLPTPQPLLPILQLTRLEWLPVMRLPETVLNDEIEIVARAPYGGPTQRPLADGSTKD